MSRRASLALFVFAILVWGVAAAMAAEPAEVKKADEPAAAAASAATPAPAATTAVLPTVAAAPATVAVKKGPLKISLELDGVFEAQSASEIVVKPEEWTVMSVLEAVKHGARVRKGDVLVKFDTEKLDKVIDDLRTELKIAELAAQQSEEVLRALEKTTPIDLQANDRVARTTEEDRKYYFDVQRPFELKATEFSLTAAKSQLEYAEEELRQLEKMYKADDVTEETEEIVLKRARDQLDLAKMRFAYAQLNHDHTLKYDFPRGDDLVNESSQRKLLDTEKNKAGLPMALNKQRLDVEKLRAARTRAEEKLKKLTADRELLTVTSPIEGVVYYGKSTRGKFADAAAAGELLRRYGVVQPNVVFMTVVQPQSITIRAAVPEDQLHRVRPGLTGVAVPTAFPQMKLPTVVGQVSDVPAAPGSFDAQLKATLGADAQAIMPGMGCKVKLTPYLKKDAVTVPPKAVMTDELDDQVQYVNVVDKDGKADKRTVTVGNKTDKQVEILSGLSEGEKVLLEAPKDQK